MRTTLVVLLLALAPVAVADEAKAPAAEKAAPSAVRPPTPPNVAPHPNKSHKTEGLENPFAEADMGPPKPVPPPPRIVVAPDIAKLGKTLAGSYSSKGVSLRGDGSSTPLEAKLVIKLDLDGAWIVESLGETKVGGIKFEDYRTFDMTAKQWTKIQLASTSGHVISSSLGEKDGTWTWEGSATSPNGTLQVRDYEQIGAKQIKVWGEAMLSGTWQKLYEATCKR
jgi:hypothetical protein